jgi:aldose 1-epimerase
MSINYSAVNHKNANNVLDKTNFETTIDGKQTDLYILKNNKGTLATFTNYGARLVSLSVPSTNGKLTDVVVGFESVQQYQTSTEPYFGATIGRYGNRIAKGKFTLDGKEYTLYKNNGNNSLHGGKKGFQDVVWDTKEFDDNKLEFTYLSKHMEEGFPGNLNVKVTYTLTDNDKLKIDYRATTDKKTVVNLTNHSFFNLNGQGSGTVNQHVLTINADYYIPVDSTLIPIGKIESVANSPFDFRKPTIIGKGLDAKNDQIKIGNGYDHTFVLNEQKVVSDLNTAATVIGDKTGIVMKVLTLEPGVQLYGGNFLQSKNTIRGGKKDDFRTAFCLETQHFPDSPNQKSFPTTVLSPGEIYKTTTEYCFSTIK